MSYPTSVELCEVGPRDGFQFEEKPISTQFKLEIIRELIAAGLSRIQVASFVHPRKVPQMADAEEIIDQLGDQDGVTVSGLVLNLKGLERARNTGLKYVDISIATNDRHSRDNANMSAEHALEEGEQMVRRALEYGLRPQIGLQTVFGYASPGDTPVKTIVNAIERFAELDLDSVSLADTTGMANPKMVEERLKPVLEMLPAHQIVLHLHDTRGLGMANVLAALGSGVSRFDTAFGGMGGCPFIPGATGNIATEDTVYLLNALGIRNGVDVGKVSACALRMERFLGKTLPGRMHTLASESDESDS